MNDENLKPFPPGVSGNPKGRPKGARSRSTIFRELLDTPATDKEGGTKAEQLIRILWNKALTDGDYAAIDRLIDGGFGKLVDKVAQTTAEGDDLQVDPTEELMRERAQKINEEI